MKNLKTYIFFTVVKMIKTSVNLCFAICCEDFCAFINRIYV